MYIYLDYFNEFIYQFFVTAGEKKIFLIITFYCHCISFRFISNYLEHTLFGNENDNEKVSHE